MKINTREVFTRVAYINNMVLLPNNGCLTLKRLRAPSSSVHEAGSLSSPNLMLHAFLEECWGAAGLQSMLEVKRSWILVSVKDSSSSVSNNRVDGLASEK